MILQTGMRTDIPAFYTPWFLNRLKAGFVLVRSPYAPQRVTRYSLSPAVVDLIGFCTKNPGPMLPHLSVLRPYAGQHWSVTLTPYGREIEPHVPPKEQVIEGIRALSAAVGPASVAWRYDPILLNGTYTEERHLAEFSRMAAALDGCVEVCIISFLDLYRKVQRNFPEARAVPAAARIRLGRAMARIAKSHHMRLKACAEGDELAPYGVDCSGCMTMEVYEHALHARLSPPPGAVHPDRKECACYLGGDIGAYDSCGHLCRYCYANASPEAVRRNRRLHDPASPFLIGGPLPGDEVRDARQESWLDGQLHF